MWQKERLYSCECDRRRDTNCECDRRRDNICECDRRRARDSTVVSGGSIPDSCLRYRRDKQKHFPQPSLFHSSTPPIFPFFLPPEYSAFPYLGYQFYNNNSSIRGYNRCYLPANIRAIPAPTPEDAPVINTSLPMVVLTCCVLLATVTRGCGLTAFLYNQ